MKLIDTEALIGPKEEALYGQLAPTRFGLRGLVRTPQALARVIERLPTKEMTRKREQERRAADREERRLTQAAQARRLRVVIGGSVSTHDEDI